MLLFFFSNPGIPPPRFLEESLLEWSQINLSGHHCLYQIISYEYVFYRKIHCLTSEFHVKFHAKNRYRTNREAMSAISVFQVKFKVEFTRQAVNFS